MYLDAGPVAVIACGYLFLLFGVAYWAERRKDRGRSIISNPLVYSLSLAVYCTSWTFYGSVGRAAGAGFSFLAVYLGPTLVAFSWWALLRKMVRIARENHITSIADFIASRYGKSGKIGALVAVMVIAGVTPYIGLQLKSVSATFDILTQQGPIPFPFEGGAAGGGEVDTAFVVALVLGVFGGMFGARALDPSERHEGMVAAIAVESVVKLAAFLVVGAWVTWGAFDGLADLFGRVSADPEYARLLTFGHSRDDSYTAWFTLLYLSSASVMLLPRQFHVMVVENCEEGHIRGAMWMFPLYLFLINLFVVPIAFAGLLLFRAPALADTYVLTVPLRQGWNALALLAFLGGLSAATGMVVVTSVSIATMFLNNLAMPILLRLGWPRDFARYLIHLKRAGILAVILAGYAYHRLLGGEFTLVNIGLISFGAAAQFAPAVIGGMYWRDATARGAAAGLLLGFGCWGYMFLVPALCQAGWLPGDLLSHGPWGLALLRPTAFLGLEGLDVWSHGLFWSFFFNTGSFFAVSMATRPSAAEAEQVERFVGALQRPGGRRPEFRLARAPSVTEFEDLLAKFIGRDKAGQKLAAFFAEHPVPERTTPPDDVLLALRSYVEKHLAGAVGPAAASQVVERYLAYKGTTLEEIFDVFGRVSISLEESREELQSRVRELSVLFEASKRVAATLDENQAIAAVLDLIREDFGLDCQGVFAVEQGRLVTRLARGCSDRYLAALRGVPDPGSYVGRAVLERRTAILADAGAATGAAALEVLDHRDLQSLIATPIVQEQQVLGVLVAGSSEKKGYFSEKFVEAFEALASELALSLTNARLYAELKELNRTLEEKVRERTRALEVANRNLQELDRLKSEFLANMSHELRTPMNSILGYTQLVMDGVDGPVSEAQHKSLERVDKNARHLLKLINDILDLSKIEAGRMDLDLHLFDLGALAGEVVEDLAGRAAAKGVVCRLETAPGDLRCEADPNKIREVLNNLVDNAIKFTDRGEVVVRVSPERREDAAGVLAVVTDTGVGIPEQSLEEIFLAFKQIDGSTTRSHGGTGLGLSIARKLVERHRGRLWVESRLGEGSRFWMWLPRGLAAQTEQG